MIFTTLYLGKPDLCFVAQTTFRLSITTSNLLCSCRNFLNLSTSSGLLQYKLSPSCRVLSRKTSLNSLNSFLVKSARFSLFRHLLQYPLYNIQKASNGNTAVLQLDFEILRTIAMFITISSGHSLIIKLIFIKFFRTS